MIEMTETKLTVQDYDGPEKPTWCPGCGDFGILNAIKLALLQSNVAPHEVLIVSGIGCGSKLPQYIKCNGLHTLHGRALPIATGARLANHDLKVMTVHGDGDGYGMGLGHMLHAIRRNVNLVDVVQNNRVYGLTKGQFSPTSERGYVSKTSPEGTIEAAVNPIALALSAGATFVARGFSGDPKHLAWLIAEALAHPGYALVDVLQPCVTFNRVKTYDWYRDRVYKVEEMAGYDAGDLTAAFQIALQWGDRIPIGVLYRGPVRPTFEEQTSALAAGPLVRQPLAKEKRFTQEQLAALRAEFF
jgi:2-oxoglutarate ferredoxin oxidoreductase subunit beta